MAGSSGQKSLRSTEGISAGKFTANNSILVANLRSFQSDSVSYFFDDLDRISRTDYTPSQKDILHCRKATKGVFEFTIRIQVSWWDLKTRKKGEKRKKIGKLKKKKNS